VFECCATSDREIIVEKSLGETAEGDNDEQKLKQRRGSAERHQRAVAAPGADQRCDRLHERDQEGKDQRELADFRGHGADE
jgi:hypothetical protein